MGTDVALAPGPDPDREPEGFVVAADDGSRLHFLDWGAPADDDGPGVLLVPGLLQPASSWAPVARRLARARRTVVSDLRGQGLSDSPMTGYDAATLAADAVAVGEGSGLLAGGRIVVAGHGFGGIVALVAAAVLGERCAGVVLVDGGWERLDVTTDVDVDEFLRGLDEPPEVLAVPRRLPRRSPRLRPLDMGRRPGAGGARRVVETAAGHVVRAVRPHVVEALVHTMFGWDPAAGVAAVGAPLAALVALGAGEPDARLGGAPSHGATRGRPRGSARFASPASRASPTT